MGVARGISIPGLTVSVGRGGCVGMTGGLPELNPPTGRFVGLPKPKSSFVSMIGLSSSSSVFLRLNMS